MHKQDDPVGEIRRGRYSCQAKLNQMARHPKRPRDSNQMARLIVDIATGLHQILPRHTGLSSARCT
jgi:hypothetical protein